MLSHSYEAIRLAFPTVASPDLHAELVTAKSWSAMAIAQ